MTFAMGIVAALVAPLTMTVGFIVWDNYWSGSAFALNMFKCNLASIGFVIMSAVTRPDNPFSSDIFELQSVGYLMLSSVIGIVVGDWTWLEGLRLLGPRRVIVMDSLKPFLAAVFGWALLDEELRIAALGGIALTVVGIMLVSLEAEQEGEDSAEEIIKVEEGAAIADAEETNRLESKSGFEVKEGETASSIEHMGTEFSTRTEATALGDPSTLSLATGSFPHSEISQPVMVDERFTSDIIKDKGARTSEPTGQDTTSENFPPGTEQEQIATAKKLPPPAPRRTNSSKRASTRRETQRGFLMAILNVVLDTYGSVLTKEHGSKYSTWEINLVRFGFAGLVMMVCSLVLQLWDYVSRRGDDNRSGNDGDEETGEEGESGAADVSRSTSLPTSHAEDTAWYKLPLESMTRSAWVHVCLGVLFVTFFTPALSNYALFQIALALALTLGSVGPLYALPLTYIMQKDQHRPTLRACLGAALAVAGIVVLAFWGTLE